MFSGMNAAMALFRDDETPGVAIITAAGAKTAYIEPGSPWENGYCESVDARFSDALLNGEIFYSLTEARILIEQWRIHDNTIRPHSSSGYRPPAPENIVPMDQRPALPPEKSSFRRSKAGEQRRPTMH